MTFRDMIQVLQTASNDPTLIEVGRKAIEDELIDLRDRRMWLTRPGGGGNGLVVRERDGSPSDIIRFGPEVAIKLALQAMVVYLNSLNDPPVST